MREKRFRNRLLSEPCFQTADISYSPIQDPRLADEETLRTLSMKSEVVACLVEEHVMCSSASGWNDGTKVWSLLHDAQKSVEHLESTGDPPASWASIRDRLRAEQARAGGKKAGVDFFFDVPVEVAKAITGFSHNEELEDAVARDGDLGEELARPGRSRREADPAVARHQDR